MRRSALFTTAAALLAVAATPTAAQPGPFDSMVVFGDSLSDNGNVSLALGAPQITRFTTNPGRVAVEDVAARFGLTLSPSLARGSDYAFGGAGVIRDWPAATGVPLVAGQVAAYLGAHPQADPQGLYAVWIGSNDVNYHLHAVGAGLIANAQVAQQTAGLPADQAAALAAQIRAQVAAGLGVASVETADQAAQELAAAAQGEGASLSRLQAAGARRIIVFNLPDFALTPDGRILGATATAMAASYNAGLDAQLAGRHGIVPVNTFGLLREVVASPGVYGFVNATAPACTTSSAYDCTPATLVTPDAASTYLFADGIHPTTATHAALADAVISELTAPGQMSLLPEASLALLRGHRAAVRQELQRQTGAGPGWDVFLTARAGRRSLGDDAAAPASRSDDATLTGGAIWRSGDGLALGAAITAGQSRVKLGGGLGGFRAKALAASAFARYDWAGGAWASLQAGLGRTDYDDIARSFAIGRAIRTERSDGKGHDASAEIAAGKWFQLGALRTGPFAAFAYDHVRVKPVVETGGDATAMWFGPQDRDAAVARLGWSLQGQASLAGVSLQPVAALAYAHDFHAGRRAVTAGLTSFNGDFNMPGYLPARSWGEASLGVTADFGGGLSGRLGYEGLFGGRARENLGSLRLSLSF